MLKQFEENPNYLFSITDIEKMSVDEREELKWLCCTDLFFLANNVCRSSNAKYKPLLRKVHGGICDTLVQKKPGVRYEDWSPIKERVILSSRGTLKSVIEAVDIVQIILCDPNIRVMVMSGKLGLAKSILRMARSHFEVNGVLGMLFPEWCAIERTNVNEFISPARTDYTLRDPTIQCATFGSTKAGSRADYIKLDDATNEVNQATPELVEKSIESYDDLDPLVEPGGYIDFTATRWAVDDLPEYIKYNGEQIEKETGRKQALYFFQPVWTVKKVADEHPEWLPEQVFKAQNERDEREKKHRLVPDDVNLLWPEKLTAEFLWPQYVKNPRKFACLPAGAPVLMADWTEKPIEQLQVGDNIVGYTTDRLTPATVEAVHREVSEVWRITTSAGRTLFCTPDHQWLRGRHRERHGVYQLLELGSHVVSVYTPQHPNSSEEQRDLDWVGGMFDGEGTVNGSLFLSQSKTINPEVWEGLNATLQRLNIVVEKYDHGRSGDQCMFHLAGGRSLRARLLQHSLMYKKKRFVSALWKQSKNVAERNGIHKIISIEALGRQEVYNIQSSSGNYVAYGYATKNCQYLLNPESATHGVFTHALLVKQTRPLSECPLPHRSLVFINWDLSGVSGKGDFAVGLVGIWEDTGRLYIIDAIIEKFRSSTDICNAILRLFKKYNPDHHRIESANGAELLSGELRMLAQKAGLDRAFYPGFDPPINEKDAKNTRIMLLPGALETNKIQFFSGITALPEIYKQLESFTGKGKYNDDGPDCLAQMWEKWKNSIGPRAVGFLTPSENVIDFQEPLVPAKIDDDPHRDEREYADMELLASMTTPHAGH